MSKKNDESRDKPRKPRTNYNVSAEDFVIAWQQSETTQEVAEKLNMPKSNVLSRASSYRNRGVQLKEMKRIQKTRLDVEELNNLSDSSDDEQSAA